MRQPVYVTVLLVPWVQTAHRVSYKLNNSNVTQCTLVLYCAVAVHLMGQIVLLYFQCNDLKYGLLYSKPFHCPFKLMVDALRLCTDNLCSSLLRYIKMCVLFVYPHTACPPNKYGVGCTSVCSCFNGATCDVKTGACSCAPGYWGLACIECK